MKKGGSELWRLLVRDRMSGDSAIVADRHVAELRSVLYLLCLCKLSHHHYMGIITNFLSSIENSVLTNNYLTSSLNK